MALDCQAIVIQRVQILTVQDRVIQPLFYRSAVRIHPAVAVVAVLAGAQLAGILGALLAIPVAAALGVAFDEIWPAPEPGQEGDGTSTAGSSAAPSAGSGPAAASASP